MALSVYDRGCNRVKIAYSPSLQRMALKQAENLEALREQVLSKNPSYVG